MAQCEFSPLVGLYHDGELDEQRRLQVERHLRTCPECAAELEDLRALSRAFAGVELPQASPEFVRRLQACGDRLDQVALARFARRLTAVAASVLVAAMCYMTFSGGQPPVHPTSLSMWEPAALAPDLDGTTTASLGSDTQFDEFIAQDVSGGHL